MTLHTGLLCKSTVPLYEPRRQNKTSMAVSAPAKEKPPAATARELFLTFAQRPRGVRRQRPAQRLPSPRRCQISLVRPDWFME